MAETQAALPAPEWFCDMLSEARQAKALGKSDCEISHLAWKEYVEKRPHVTEATPIKTVGIWTVQLDQHGAPSNPGPSVKITASTYEKGFAYFISRANWPDFQAAVAAVAFP